MPCSLGATIESVICNNLLHISQVAQSWPASCRNHSSYGSLPSRTVGLLNLCWLFCWSILEKLCVGSPSPTQGFRIQQNGSLPVPPLSQGCSIVWCWECSFLPAGYLNMLYNTFTAPRGGTGPVSMELAWIGLGFSSSDFKQQQKRRQDGWAWLNKSVVYVSDTGRFVKGSIWSNKTSVLLHSHREFC